MAGYGPPDDFSNQLTQRYDAGGQLPYGPPEPSGSFGAAPTPWYRKPAALVGWGLLVLILIGLITFGIVRLFTGGPSGTPTTTTTATTTTASTTSTTTTASPTSTTTTTTTTAPTTTTTTAAPSPSAAPPPPRPPTQQPPRRPRLPGEIPKLPPIPSTIILPHVPTVITLPPGL